MPEDIKDISGPVIHQPFDSPLRWMIESRSHPNRDGGYLVDLGAYGGRGCCQCPDFQCRVGPATKTGRWVSCHHIRVARERFMWWAIMHEIEIDQNRAHDQAEGIP